MRRCFVVANCIGRDETIETLIPLLGDHIISRGIGFAFDSDNNSSSSPTANNSVVPTRIEEDDEILLILAEQLGQLVLSGLVPGYRSLGIIAILERLAMVEETVVRDRAVLSIHCIIPLIIGTGNISGVGKSEEEAVRNCVRHGPGLLVNMIKRLTSAEWFTAKVSACAVLPSVYQFLNTMKSGTPILTGGSGMDAGEQQGHQGTSVEETKRQLRALYKGLSEEDSPMIRRGAGKNLGRYVEAVANISPHGTGSVLKNDDDVSARGLSVPAAKGFVLPGGKDEILLKKAVTAELKNRVLDEVVPVYQALASDEQDSVRLLAVSSSGSFGCALGLDGDLCAKAILPVIKAGSTDLSWRVRHNLAKEFSVVAQSQGFHESSHSKHLTELFQFYSSLLQDFEAEVRTSSVENFARMVQLGGTNLFVSHLAPVLPSLADDLVMEVRSKFAEALMDCCDESICTALSDKIILQEFKPLLEGFLNDEFADVQLHILSKLSRVTHLLDKMDIVVQCILSMAKALNWRVREAVGQLFPHLTEARGVAFFELHLFDTWMKLLSDRVADVRLACVNGMPKLLSVTGGVWIQREIVPRYVRIYDNSESYLSRITVLRSFTKLAITEKGLTSSLTEELVTHLLKGLQKDQVANVRIVAARGLAEISHTVEEGLLNSRIRPALQTCSSEDEDEDCQYFAQTALESCSG